MKIVYKIFRAIFVSLLLVLPVVAVTLYVVLSLPGVQGKLRDIASRELTTLLGSEVEIGSVNIAPFNRVAVKDAVVRDENGVEALKVGHLGAGISITDLLLHGKLVVSYAELIDFDIKLYRDSASTPLNIAPILERLKGKEGDEKKHFDLAVNTIVIRRGLMSYDVLSAPEADPGHFDSNHIGLRDFRADIIVPKISDKAVAVEVKRLGVSEKSGLKINNLRMNFDADSVTTAVTDLRIESGRSRILISDASVGIPLLDLKNCDPKKATIKLTTLPGSVVNPADFAAFQTALGGLNYSLEPEIDLSGTVNDISISRLSVEDSDRNFAFQALGRVRELESVELEKLVVSATSPMLLNTLSAFLTISPAAEQIIESAENIDIMGNASLSAIGPSVDFTGAITCAAGAIDADISYCGSVQGSGKVIESRLEAVDFHPSVLLPHGKVRVESFSGVIDGMVKLSGPDSEGNVSVVSDHLEINDHLLSDIAIDASLSNRILRAEVFNNSEMYGMRLDAKCDFSNQLPLTKVVGQFDNFDLSPFISSGVLSSTVFGMTLVADVEGKNIDNIAGNVKISDVYLIDSARSRSMRINQLQANLDRDDDMATMHVSSDFMDGVITGRLRPSAVVPAVRRIFSSVYPSILSPSTECKPDEGAMAFSLIVNPDSAVTRYFNLPVEPLDNVRVWGVIDNFTDQISVNVDAPYLWQKGKLIESTKLNALIDASESTAGIDFTTIMPSKYGPMTLSVNASGEKDAVLTNLGWNIKAKEKYDGAIKVDATFRRDSTIAENPLCANIDVLRSNIVFNDTVWEVTPSNVSLRPGMIAVDHFHAGRLGQHIDIDGLVSNNPIDVLNVKLQNIDLGYVFETLNINHVTFGGIATGDFYASQLFDASRHMYTPALDVKGFSYNDCVLGDAIIRSHWNADTQGIAIEADITEPEQRLTNITGEIRPVASELDFHINADKVPVGFLTPFMNAFAGTVTGFASGKARLYGTFHDINLTGELLAEDFSLPIKFTNTTYTVKRDSVIITPGIIDLKNIMLNDRYGHTAKLSGALTHNYFHDASFRFNITDARDLLCYDISERMATEPWYGRVFGSGGVNIIGEPGTINIGVNLTTSPGTTFTLKLDNSLSAQEYDFITFTDRDRARKDSLKALDPLPHLISELRNRRVKAEEGTPTEYTLDFNLDVTPAASLSLIMDPKSGDKIQAVGQGHMRMTYASTGDFKMFGTYNIERGNYNFTLQDIIIKDFSIAEGSNVKFNGNPDAAQLDIKATYTVNANLTDLDESFSQDKELNRTNVPVNAVLMVTGDMRQPDIDFDLEFPTLTRDVDRKVRSIVSTDEMMNRQIIYLLALNRFYTPDYMNATRGNELVSVASSTISSQLSSMLGQLSDKWSIAPNFRSDRGDFSDVEVDVALSSHLLNNRLLLNGNFGYRDKSLNNNSFIGDFDIRYLLNRAGTISLKAYNRYNDQNYYLKSALTTQGVGIVFKRDFDNWMEFINPIKNWLLRRKSQQPEPVSESSESEAPES